MGYTHPRVRLLQELLRGVWRALLRALGRYPCTIVQRSTYLTLLHSLAAETLVDLPPWASWRAICSALLQHLLRAFAALAPRFCQTAFSKSLRTNLL